MKNHSRLSAILLSTLALLVGCAPAAVAPLPAPPEVKIPPTSSSVPDFSATSLPPVPGQTTVPEVRVTPGAATISGRVSVGGAPVPGAVVRIERFVGDASATVDVRSNDEGRYSAVGVAGGRYRIRAFRPPDATMTQPVTLFVNDTETRSLDLAMTRFGGANTVSVSGSPAPILGSISTVSVTLTRPGVDDNGVARSVPVPGVAVLLTTAGGRNVVTPNPTATDGAGRAAWNLRCDSIEAQGLSATFADGSQINVNVPPCRLPPPTTTTAPPATDSGEEEED